METVKALGRAFYPCKEMAMSAQIGDVYDTRRHAAGRCAEALLWFRPIGCIVILALTILVVSLTANAQPTKVYRLGWLGFGSLTTMTTINLEAFRQGLR